MSPRRALLALIALGACAPPAPPIQAPARGGSPRKPEGAGSRRVVGRANPFGMPIRRRT